MAFSCSNAIKTLVLSLTASLALQAQIGTNLAPVTDVLDVYKSGGVKPEMVTMLDMSGSMTGVFWHRKFWTNKDYGTHVGGTPGDDSVQFTIDTSLDNATYNTLTMSTFDTNLGRRWGPSSSYRWQTDLAGYLVDADGVRISGTLTMAKVKTATHARMTGSRKIAGTTYTRTVDMPFPWTLLKAKTAAPLTTNPLPNWVDGIADPDVTVGGSYIAYDTTYEAAAQVTNPSGSDGLDSWFTFNRDYVDWMFFGMDSKGASGSDNYGAGGTYKDDNGNVPSAGGTVGTSPATGGFIIPGSSVNAGNKLAFGNGLPVGTRCQYLKRAVLTAWFGNRDRVWWAYRFLDDSSNEEGLTTISATNFTTRGTRTKERDLILLEKSTSGSTHASVKSIQSKVPSSVTPLTYALANILAQFTVDDAHPSVFDRNGTSEVPPPCRASYVILFTDGNANDSLTAGRTSGNALGSGGGTWTSEAQIQSGISYANLSPGSSNFNIWSLAAVAAHGLPNASQTYWGAQSPGSYAPFIIKSRGSAGTSGRRITTMTVGLCLSGTNTDSGGGKGPLLKAALFGDPKTAGYDITTAVPFGGVGGAQTNFFDATDPTYLANSLSAIMRRVVSANTGITAPSAPLVGLNLGNRAYLGRFESNNDGQGSIWKGDLLMTGIGIQTDGTIGLKAADGSFQQDINANNAVASASIGLVAKKWLNRKVYTVIPGSTLDAYTVSPASTIPAAGLDLTASAQNFDESNTSLVNNVVMGTADTTSAVSLIRFIRGAGTSAQAATYTVGSRTSNASTRNDIMGDIVNSSPAAVEYDPALIPAYSPLSTLWTSTYSTLKDARFQLIFVGDNQGHFHCFGEVSGFDTAGQLKASLDELWTFIPPEFLNKSSGPNVNKLGQLMGGDPNSHLFAVDGSPIIYFNDAPVTGRNLGNFKVDTTSSVTGDTVRVVFGLRKGGRSYYALNIINPSVPKLAWALDPNNSTDPTIKTMGLSTSTIGLAEVDTGSPSAPKDVVVLGGGYSNNELDALVGAKLGRSLLVLNVLDGSPVKLYDFVSNTALAAAFPDMGAITAGGFPFQFLLGSGRAQRVYFGDQSGGVYALGSMETLTTGAPGWRKDNSNIDQWTTDGSSNTGVSPLNAGVRWIYKGQTTLTSGKVTASSPVTTIPVAFRSTKSIPQFLRPSGSTYAPNMIPPVVGVTFGTGDRNDPMDKDPINPVGSRVNRQVMIFDRQDSADLPTTGGLPSNVNTSGGAITDAQLADLTSVTTAGDTSYLGNNRYLGYFLRFHTPSLDPNDASHMLYEKAYLTPIVSFGALIFSTFRPTSTGSSTTCQGAGTTYTYRMSNALSPAFGNGDVSTSASGTGDGYVFSWANLAGDFTAVGSRLVLQSGQDATSSANNSVAIKSLKGGSGSLAFAPRTWRIIR